MFLFCRILQKINGIFWFIVEISYDKIICEIFDLIILSIEEYDDTRSIIGSN